MSSARPGSARGGVRAPSRTRRGDALPVQSGPGRIIVPTRLGQDAKAPTQVPRSGSRPGPTRRVTLSAHGRSRLRFSSALSSPGRRARGGHARRASGVLGTARRPICRPVFRRPPRCTRRRIVVSRSSAGPAAPRKSRFAGHIGRRADVRGGVLGVAARVLLVGGFRRPFRPDELDTSGLEHGLGAGVPGSSDERAATELESHAGRRTRVSAEQSIGGVCADAATRARGAIPLSRVIRRQGADVEHLRGKGASCVAAV